MSVVTRPAATSLGTKDSSPKIFPNRLAMSRKACRHISSPASTFYQKPERGPPSWHRAWGIGGCDSWGFSQRLLMASRRAAPLPPAFFCIWNLYWCWWSSTPLSQWADRTGRPQQEQQRSLAELGRRDGSWCNRVWRSRCPSPSTRTLWRSGRRWCRAGPSPTVLVFRRTENPWRCAVPTEPIVNSIEQEIYRIWKKSRPLAFK